LSSLLKNSREITILNFEQMQITIPISLAELIDKISILEIKKAKIKNPEKLQNVEYELQILVDVIKSEKLPKNKIYEFKERLIKINGKLWDIEDRLRLKEKANVFDEEFIKLARLVYITNDERAEVKKELNVAFGSKLIEEKEYTASNI